MDGPSHRDRVVPMQSGCRGSNGMHGIAEFATPHRLTVGALLLDANLALIRISLTAQENIECDRHSMPPFSAVWHVLQSWIARLRIPMPAWQRCWLATSRLNSTHATSRYRATRAPITPQASLR